MIFQLMCYCYKILLRPHIPFSILVPVILTVLQGVHLWKKKLVIFIITDRHIHRSYNSFLLTHLLSVVRCFSFLHYYYSSFYCSVRELFFTTYLPTRHSTMLKNIVRISHPSSHLYWVWTRICTLVSQCQDFSLSPGNVLQLKYIIHI